MFSNDDNSGLGVFLACLIVLVLAGVALSLVFDGSIRMSRSGRLLREELEAGAAEVSHLTQELSAMEVRLKEEGERRRRASESLRLAGQSAAMAASRKRTLTESVESLRTACYELGKSFASYRTKSREIRWKQAVGRQFGVVRLKSGREFRQVVIARVTADGLEIRHESGTARISSFDLDPVLCDEFQWDPVDPAGVAPEVSRPPDGVAENPSVAPAAGRTPAASPDDKQIAALRENVRVWRSRLGSLKAQRADALSRASYSGAKSVPGSLQTWAQRAESVATQIARAEVELARSLSALAVVSPDDPLLRPVRN